jgi:fructose-1,6-bisphosphatase/inositol monophosphatase family enzyme
VDTDEILQLLRDVAEEVINPRFQALRHGEIHEKNPGDLVTVADHEAEERITRALRTAYPEAVVLGEEDFAGNSSVLEEFLASEHAFTVDPVDGTKNFVDGSPDHAVMVAETRSGETVRGWIWQPQHGRAYVAERGAGAYRDGERLTRDAAPAEPGELRGVTSMRKQVGRTHGTLAPLELTWVCCGIDYPKLVEGAADFVLYGSVRPWDHAAGSLLVTEAGGYSGDLTGTAYRPSDEPSRLLVAADETTHERVRGQLSVR